MRTPQRIERALRRALYWAPMSAAVTTLFAILLALLFTRQFNLLWIAASLLVAGFVRRRARKSLLAGAPDPNPLTERIARVGAWLLAALVLLAGGGVRYSTCPHGTLAGLGPVGVAYSTVGGPCRNTVLIEKKWNVFGNWYVWVTNPRI